MFTTTQQITEKQFNVGDGGGSGVGWYGTEAFCVLEVGAVSVY